MPIVPRETTSQLNTNPRDIPSQFRIEEVNESTRKKMLGLANNFLKLFQRDSETRVYTPPRKKRLQRVLLTVMLLTATGVAGYYFYDKSQQRPEEKPIPSLTGTDYNIEDAEADPDPTATQFTSPLVSPLETPPGVQMFPIVPPEGEILPDDPDLEIESVPLPANPDIEITEEPLGGTIPQPTETPAPTETPKEENKVVQPPEGEITKFPATVILTSNTELLRDFMGRISSDNIGEDLHSTDLGIMSGTQLELTSAFSFKGKRYYTVSSVNGLIINHESLTIGYSSFSMTNDGPFVIPADGRVATTLPTDSNKVTLLKAKNNEGDAVLPEEKGLAFKQMAEAPNLSSEFELPHNIKTGEPLLLEIPVKYLDKSEQFYAAEAQMKVVAFADANVNAVSADKSSIHFSVENDVPGLDFVGLDGATAYVNRPSSDGKDKWVKVGGVIQLLQDDPENEGEQERIFVIKSFAKDMVLS